MGKKKSKHVPYLVKLERAQAQARAQKPLTLGQQIAILEPIGKVITKAINGTADTADWTLILFTYNMISLLSQRGLFQNTGWVEEAADAIRSSLHRGAMPTAEEAVKLREMVDVYADALSAVQTAAYEKATRDTYISMANPDTSDPDVHVLPRPRNFANAGAEEV